MQKGFNTLKDQLKTLPVPVPIPEEMVGFFADCAKNIPIQENVTKELSNKGPGESLNT